MYTNYNVKYEELQHRILTKEKSNDIVYANTNIVYKKIKCIQNKYKKENRIWNLRMSHWSKQLTYILVVR